MTNQEAFDINWNYFVVGKGKRSTAGGGICAYRGEGGSKCGIGLLIPDDKYDPVFEGSCVPDGHPPSEGKRYAFLRVLNELGFGDDQLYFLSELQDCHDNAPEQYFHKAIESSLRELADRFDLTVPSVNSTKGNQ